MAGNEQNIVSEGLNAAKANAEDQQLQQQVEQLESQLNNQAGSTLKQTKATEDNTLS
jgi:hypothetical protein